MTNPIEPVTAWAAVCTTGSPRPFIHADTVHDLAADARGVIGSAWRRFGETRQQGWKRAYRKGWRVVRVEIRVKEEG